MIKFMVQAFDSKHNKLNFYLNRRVHKKMPPNQLLALIMTNINNNQHYSHHI